jgi:DNA (cytosine-5)-methyltransferase 1
MMLRVLDLFCGAGGLSLGLEESGLRVVAGVDEWDAAMDTYASSHQHTQLYRLNVYEFIDNLLDGTAGIAKGDIDVIAGGPPCQGFCGMNRHRSVRDKRNSLVEAFVQCVELLQPRFVCMENVTGLMSLGHGVYLRSLLEAFAELGYRADYRLVQAGYYGVPQNRWRFILFASKEGRPLVWPEPLHRFHRTAVHNLSGAKGKVLQPLSDERSLFHDPLPRVTVADAISDLPAIDNGGGGAGPYPLPPTSALQNWVRSGSDRVANHRCPKVGALHLERFSHIPRNKANSGWLDLPEHLQPRNLRSFSAKSYDNRFGRLNWDGTFNAIMSKVEPYWGRVIHPEQDRLISARECARAQGFPDRVHFQGSLAEVYKQIGNAVPVPLARAIGAAICENLGIESPIVTQYIEFFRNWKAWDGANAAGGA